MTLLETITIVAWSVVVVLAYAMGRASGRLEMAKHFELSRDDSPLFEDIAGLVQRYRGLVTNGAIMHRLKHDFVILWCSDGIHHGVHVKPGDGAVVFELLGLTPQVLMKIVSVSESPRKPST